MKQSSIIRRIHIIQGQLSAIENAIQSKDNTPPDCEKIMYQIKAAKNGFESLGGVIVQEFMNECLQNTDTIDTHKVQKILKVFSGL